MFGHVTSSYYSVALGRSIALALVKDGFKRRDDQARNKMVAWANGVATPITLVSSVFVDAEGAKHDA